MSWLDPIFRTGYRVLQLAGVQLPQQVTLNFASGFVVTDDPTNNRTNVSIGGTVANPTFTGTVTNNATLTILGGDAKSKPQTTTGNIATSTAAASTANLYSVAVGEVYFVDALVWVDLSGPAAATIAGWKLSAIYYGAAGPAATISGSVLTQQVGTWTPASLPTLVTSGANIQLQVTSPDTTARTWNYEAHVGRGLF